MKLKDFILNSLCHDYRPGVPDFKKIMALHFSVVLSFICVWVIITTSGNEEVVIWGLITIMGGLVGFNVAPMFSKNGSAIKSQELTQMVDQSADLKARAKLIGLPETATKEEIEAAELKKKEEAI